MQRKSHGLIGDLRGSGNGNSDNHQVLFLNQTSLKVLFLQVLRTICHFINIPWKKIPIKIRVYPVLFGNIVKYVCIDKLCLGATLLSCIISLMDEKTATWFYFPIIFPLKNYKVNFSCYLIRTLGFYVGVSNIRKV